MSTLQVQSQYEQQQAAQQAAIAYPAAPPAYGAVDTAPAYSAQLYPSLDDYMGLSLSPEFLEKNMAVVPAVSIANNAQILCSI